MHRHAHGRPATGPPVHASEWFTLRSLFDNRNKTAEFPHIFRHAHTVRPPGMRHNAIRSTRRANAVLAPRDRAPKEPHYAMIDDARDLPDGAALATDVCIVGAGAAGITLALELAGTGTEVLLLESGGRAAEKATQRLYEGAVADARLHGPPHRYRQRRFGGTTTIWGGRCMPFDPIDFEPRDYVAHSGWPIGYADLLPFYPEANRLCEAGDFCYTAADCLLERARPMIAGFQGESFSSDTLERFSCPTDFGARYGHRLRAARNIQVVLHANVCAVHLRQGGDRVQAVEVRTLRGRLLQVRASQFVLAAGGLEVTRLLLASNDVQADGIGNRHDVLGRYYMCHLAGTIGALQVRLPAGAVHHGYEISDE